MQINSLTIRMGMQLKRYDFCPGFNLITSRGVNSVGKTTLMRSILFSLGENVPGTQKFRPLVDDKEFRIDLSDGDRRISMLRSKQTVRYQENGNETRYALPYDLRAIKARLYGVNNHLAADNLLGTHYIDQDKGWTLLNRGKVISSIGFKIEDLIRGLADYDQSHEQAQVAELEQEIKRYSFARAAAGYQRDVLEDDTRSIPSQDSTRDFSKLQQLSMRASYLRKRIRGIRKAQRDNERFIEYVEQLKLSVKSDSGEPIVVTAENLVGYNDQNSYMDAQVVQLSSELEEAERGISNLRLALSTDKKLFEPGSEIDLLDMRIADLKIDAGALEKALKELQTRKRKIVDSIEEGLKNSKPYTFLADTVVDYAKRLEVYDDYAKDGNGILTDSIKEKSGAFYQSLVLAFRLAYAKAVEKYCKVRLPLIIDSPRNGELSSKNFRLHMNLLTEEFKGWQIIIASITEEDIPSDNTITIKSMMMEDAVLETSIIEKNW